MGKKINWVVDYIFISQQTFQKSTLFHTFSIAQTYLFTNKSINAGV